MPIDPGHLRWQCRRGMRELDVLLRGWLDRYYSQAGDDRKAAFEALLQLPDPELNRYLLGGNEMSDPIAADVIRQIQGFHTA